MLFNSFEFLVFLPTVIGLYFLLRNQFRAQNLLLLAASYFFYGWWDIRFLFLIVITTVVDYNTALIVSKGKTTSDQRLRSGAFLAFACFSFVLFDWQNLKMHGLSEGVIAAAVCVALLLVAIAQAERILGAFSEKTRAKIALTFSIVTNLTILGFFKYFNFFADSFSQLSLMAFGVEPSYVTLSIVLPVGISFYTFQSMSYTIDVYRKDMKATERLVEFATYLSFFPQLVAGPIERGKNLLPQFQAPRSFNKEAFRTGIWLICWGMYKKVVIADNLALIVNGTFAPYDAGTVTSIPENGLLSIIAVYAFAFQIYADFSGYSDIARGIAKLFGFELMVNFRLPYISCNPSEFWRRWHISLSSWLRDYLYISLGGNRGGKFNTYRNLFLTMLLGGLWHGASWTFVAWGAYQGTLLILYRLSGFQDVGTNAKPHIRALHILFMFQLICIGWLIFRAQNMETIYLFLASLFTGMSFSIEAIAQIQTLMFYIIPLLCVQMMQMRFGSLYVLNHLSKPVNFHIWFFVIMSILVLRHTGTSEFIYFAF